MLWVKMSQKDSLIVAVCEERSRLAVLCENFEHLNCTTDHSDFKAVGLNETVFQSLPRILANE